MKKWEYMNLQFKMNIDVVVQHLERDLISNNVFLHEKRKEGWEVASIDSAPSNTGDLNLVVFLRREIDSQSENSTRTVST